MNRTKVVRVTIYVEGGGDGSQLRNECRRGFIAFFEKAGFAKRMPKVVACGGRVEAYRKFCKAVGQRRADVPLLLVDSEGPIGAWNPSTPGVPWAHLKNRVGDHWERPDGATDDSVHLTVQMMESWFLADRECLARYFGADFNENSLPAPQRKLEEVPKGEVAKALKESTRQCERKGRYDKGEHSFQLLRELDVSRVVEASPYARRLVETVAAKLAS